MRRGRGGWGGAGVDVGAWEVAGVIVLIVGVGESVEGLACKRAFMGIWLDRAQTLVPTCA